MIQQITIEFFNASFFEVIPKKAGEAWPKSARRAQKCGDLKSEEVGALGGGCKAGLPAMLASTLPCQRAASERAQLRPVLAAESVFPGPCGRHDLQPELL
jgi:hypothetical protein